MSLGTLRQILRLSPSIFSPPSVTATSAAMHSHKNRKYAIDNRRTMASTAKKKNSADEGRSRSCPSKQAGKKEKKDSFWGGIFGGGGAGGSEKTTKKNKNELPECCKDRKLQAIEARCKEEPDLSDFEGQAYRTCGSAYVIRKEVKTPPAVEPSKEDKILKKLEAHPELKAYTEDPMPSFSTVEQRMMDLDQRKLHPLYKMYQSRPKKPKLDYTNTKAPAYKSRSGPVNIHEMPAQLKINKNLLVKKNMYADYKRVEPPRQMIARLLEIEQNAQPTLKRKSFQCKKPSKRKAVYETLKQKSSVTLDNLDTER